MRLYKIRTFSLWKIIKIANTKSEVLKYFPSPYVDINQNINILFLKIIEL